MVLVASLTIPANAASWITLVPAEHISSTHYEGNIRLVTYDFGRVPLIAINEGTTWKGTAQLIPTYGATQNQLFYVYPLGFKVTSGPSLSYNSSNVAIDISDFKPTAALTASSSLFLEFDVNYSSYSQYLDEGYSLTVKWSFNGYNASGGYIGAVEQTSYSEIGTLQDVMGEQYRVEIPINMTISPMSFSETARYVIPVCTVQYTTYEDEPDINIDYWRLSCEDFTITTRTDMLLQNSLSLQAIENQLGDLNDKADTIINGSDEMNQDAQHSSGLAQDQQEEANRVEDLEKEYLDDFDASSEILNDKVTDFVDGTGFNQLTALVAPIMNWEHSGLIMLLVIAFINMSVIMFGR